MQRGFRNRATERFAADYADSRTTEQRCVDSENAERQAAALTPSPRRADFENLILRRLQGRRDGREDLLHFDLLPRRLGEAVPVVVNQLLVRASIRDDAAVWAMVLAEEPDQPPTERLNSRLLQLSFPNLSVQQLDDLARLVRRSGHEASVNHIAPLAPLVKGEGGPEPTTPLVYPPEIASRLQAQREVQVAVIDTGIAVGGHSSWFQNLAVAEVDELDAIPTQDGFLDFAAGHGTLSAGVIAQVAPNATLAIYRAVDTDGIGSEVDVAEAMVRAAEGGACVLNLSLGAETVDDQPLLALDVAREIIREQDSDILVVAAAGNSGSQRPVFPAASRDVVGVGALNDDMGPAEWSSRGYWVTCSTVGRGIRSTYVNGVESSALDPDPDDWTSEPEPWATCTGTSFAAPQITGLIARICGENAELTPRQALSQILDGCHRMPDFGRVLRILPGS